MEQGRAELGGGGDKRSLTVLFEKIFASSNEMDTSKNFFLHSPHSLSKVLKWFTQTKKDIQIVYAHIFKIGSLRFERNYF